MAAAGSRPQPPAGLSEAACTVHALGRTAPGLTACLQCSAPFRAPCARVPSNSGTVAHVGPMIHPSSHVALARPRSHTAFPSGSLCVNGADARPFLSCSGRWVLACDSEQGAPRLSRGTNLCARPLRTLRVPPPKCLAHFSHLQPYLWSWLVGGLHFPPLTSLHAGCFAHLLDTVGTYEAHADTSLLVYARPHGDTRGSCHRVYQARAVRRRCNSESAL